MSGLSDDVLKMIPHLKELSVHLLKEKLEEERALTQEQRQQPIPPKKRRIYQVFSLSPLIFLVYFLFRTYHLRHLRPQIHRSPSME